MKVIAFNGSGRKDGNTAILIRRVLKVLEEQGMETELIQLAGETIHGCNACRTCYKTKNERCIIENDNINEYVQKMKTADGIILGSPTYFSMMTSEMKALIDRTGYVARANNHIFKRKIGAAIVAVRRGRRNAHIRRHKPLLPHQPDDSTRLNLLEPRHRKQERRSRERRRRHENNGDSGQEHGMANQKNKNQAKKTKIVMSSA